MSKGLRDLKVWQEAVALAGDVVRAIRQHNRRETRTVGDAVMASALATACEIAEGYGRYTAPEQRTCYQAARRALARLETQLAIITRADLLPAATLAELSQRIHSVSRLLGGYLVYLERQANTTVDDDRRPVTPAAGAP